MLDLRGRVSVGRDFRFAGTSLRWIGIHGRSSELDERRRCGRVWWKVWEGVGRFGKVKPGQLLETPVYTIFRSTNYFQPFAILLLKTGAIRGTTTSSL